MLPWKGINPAAAGLWDRIAAAPTFESILRPAIDNPDIDLDRPDCGTGLNTPANLILDGIPAATSQYLARRAGSLEHMKFMADDYRLHRGY